MAPTDAPVVLVVEDHKAMRQALADLLKAEGYQVATAPDGAEALRYLKDGGCPCIVLLDLTISVLDGWEFLGELQANADLAVFPVAVMSALDAQEAVGDYPQAVVYLRKPFEIPTLLNTVARSCGKE